MSFAINEPELLEVNLTQIQNILCNGDDSGSVNLITSGGTGNIEFTLENETNLTGTFENLTAGNYEIFVIDSNMCTSSIEIIISEPAAITLTSESLQPVSCFGENDGGISIITSGGIVTLTYILGSLSNTTGVFENLPAGDDYNITVLDGNNCTNTFSAFVLEPAPISSTINFTNSIQCFGE